jgi:hypothetical protein
MVTSRATGDDLVEDEDAQAVDTTGDITAPPRQSARKAATAKPGSAKTAPADETQDVPAKNTPVKDVPAPDAKANGGPAAKGTARPAPVDATMVDGIPAFPADTIGSSRGTKVQDPEPAVTSFGPPPSAPAKPALEDPTIAYPAETAAKPSGDTTAATSASSPVSSSPVSSSSASSGTSSAAPPATEASSMPPAAFAWEMPDPPADSPSSPARAFLRSGLTAKNPPPAPAASTTRTAPPPPAGKPAATEAPVRAPAKSGPVTFGQSRSGPAKGGTGPKAQQKAQSKKSARQAHLTISRVEPWSVMKFSFVVSLVAFVILFVAVSVLYGALSGLGVFDSLQRVVTSLTSSQGSTGVNAKAWFSASRVLGYTALLGSLNIVLITAMSTIGSVVYNLTSRLVGGVEVTLRETE